MVKSKNLWRIAALLIGLVGMADVFCASVIINQQKTIADLQQRSNLKPIIFPAEIPPAPTTSLYMSASSNGANPDYNQSWRLDVDTTPTCRGIRVCNIGFIAAEKNGKLDPYYHSLPDNKDHLKQKVKLRNNITGYYTPFHILASGVNPILEWKMGQVLFTLSWRIEGDPAQQEQTLIAMANSAINAYVPK